MNIELTLAAAREELKRQQEIEKAATSGPWRRDAISISSEVRVEGKLWPQLNSMSVPSIHWQSDIDLICLSRNLNPARLGVVEDLLDSISDYVAEGSHDRAFLNLTATCTLLGIQAVE